MVTRLCSFVSIAVVALLVLAACGSGAAEEAGQEPEDQATRVVAEGAPAFEPVAEGSPAAEEEAPAEAAGGAAPAGGEAAQSGGAPLTLVGYDIGWRLGEQDSAQGEIPLTVAPGAVISLPNEGAGPHNFAVDALGVDVDMPVGETVEATIPADAAPGEYEYYCNVPGHKALMKGTLIVDPAAAAPAPAAGASPAPEQAAAAPAPEQAAGDPAAPITLVGYDIGWRFGEQDSAQGDIPLTVSPGAVITLPNEGAGPHNFAVDALGVDVDMPVGQTVEATIPADAAPGEYEYYCNVPGHKALMKGTLIVQ